MDLVFPPPRIRKFFTIETYPSRVFSTDEFCNFEQKCVSFFENSTASGTMRLLLTGSAAIAGNCMVTQFYLWIGNSQMIIHAKLWIRSSKMIPPIVFFDCLYIFGNVRKRFFDRLTTISTIVVATTFVIS